MQPSVLSGSGNAEKDWRVRLSLPPAATGFYRDSPLMAPLKDTDGMIFPVTPTIIVQNSANYTPQELPHTNYPYYAYNNSRVDAMSIIGNFPVQNATEGQYWLASMHFLRTASKMFFGEDEGYGLKGNPPPIFHLYGYGDHMFNKVPVIINTFNVELRSGIDYISTQQSDVYRSDSNIDYQQQDSTWAPTLSTISVLVSPIYSRDSVKNFSMSKFVRGELNGKGANEIGFI